MPYVPLAVSSHDLRRLREWVTAADTRASLRLRAQVVLMLHAGGRPAAVARQLHCSVQTVVAWRDRFRSAGLDGLHDAPRSGRPVSVDPSTIVRATLRPPPGARRWSSRSMAEHLGVSNVTVANVWRDWGLRPGGPNSVILQVDPVLDRAPIAILGLHVARDARILALLVDEGVVGTLPPEPSSLVGAGAHLSRLLADTAAGNHSDPAEPARRDFLRAVEDLAARPGDRPVSASVRLVAARISDAAPVQDSAVLTMHAVPPSLEWDKVARVACALVGQTGPSGSASILDMCAAIDQNAGRGWFSWVR